MAKPTMLSCSAVRELDSTTIEQRGVPSMVLMENAGRACAVACQEMLAEASGGQVVVLAGPGNNGGDGFVIARTLFNRGIPVKLYFVGELANISNLSDDTQANARLWRELAPGETTIHEVAPNGTGLDRLKQDLGSPPALVVDGLFGNGLSRDLTGIYMEVVELANAARRKGAQVLAVDLPSGLHGDTGAVLGVAIRADRTVTFVAAKPGLTLGAGPAHAGQVQVAEIGIPRPLIEAALHG